MVIFLAYKQFMEIIDDNEGGDLHQMVPVIRERLKNLIRDYKEKTGYSLEKIGEICGLSKVHISTIRSGRRGKNLTLNAALKIWEGLGNPLETLLNPEPRQPIITILGELPRVPSWVRPEDYLAVPLVEGRIAAGAGRIVSEEITDLVWVYKPELGHRRNLVAVHLAPDAHSMEPTIRAGSIVIIDRDDQGLDPPGIHAVRTFTEACAMKRVRLAQGRAWLISDNPEYPPEPSEYENLNDLIIGRVIWSWTSWLK